MAMDREEQADFLLHSLGLRGALWNPSESSEKARALAMIQIDSIRVTGLRNHEIAWAARSEAPIEELYALFYRERGMIETHYPIFATKREWLPYFLKDFRKYITRPSVYQELRPMMRRILRRIREEGPVTPADFDTERVSGGFNTIKASTRALEYLYLEGKVQIAGRTPHFHRLFDLTERVAPEALAAPENWRSHHRNFFVRSALEVLKLANRRQWQERISHHWNPRGGMADAQKMLARFLKNLPDDILEVEGGLYLFKKDWEAWERQRSQKGREEVRLLPPLDNLLFHRKRFSELFGFTYKFEAYTPQKNRQFYYALPILYRNRIVGLIDPKRRGNLWYIDGLRMLHPVSKDALRNAVHRFARLAGCDSIELNPKIDREWKQLLKGKVP